MASTAQLHTVFVEGLHNQFDVDITLQPGLNVIYGKNGRGKTTLLHLIANLLELDFTIFEHLQFRRIVVGNTAGDQIELNRRSPGESVAISLNGRMTSFSGENTSLSNVELTDLRKALGDRPTYLPAFRSVLERGSVDAGPSYYRGAEQRDKDYSDIVDREIKTLRECSGIKNPNALQEEALSTAQKTVLCRQWFGRFVPIIRYPSVSDVVEGLSDEWRRAQFEIANREQRMFEETFVRVFRTIAGIDSNVTDQSNDNLLNSISSLLNDKESQLAGRESKEIYVELLQAVKKLSSTSSPLKGIDSSVLEIYRHALNERNNNRRDAFQKSRDFEISVNKFLDGKDIKIGQSTVPNVRSRNNVVVTADGGQSYGLSALSSGERQIVTMLYSASRTRFRSGVFLIDEPELSLHIDWQRIILQELQRQSPGRQIIACTHSPEVGADHVLEAKTFEPKISRQQQLSTFTDEDV